MVVSAAEVFCVLGTPVGVGVLGTSVDQRAGGAVRRRHAARAHRQGVSTWSVVYTGLAAYTVWQWLPSQATEPRVRQTGGRRLSRGVGTA